MNLERELPAHFLFPGQPAHSPGISFKEDLPGWVVCLSTGKTFRIFQLIFSDQYKQYKNLYKIQIWKNTQNPENIIQPSSTRTIWVYRIMLYCIGFTSECSKFSSMFSCETTCSAFVERWVVREWGVEGPRLICPLRTVASAWVLSSVLFDFWLLYVQGSRGSQRFSVTESTGDQRRTHLGWTVFATEVHITAITLWGVVSCGLWVFQNWRRCLPG